MKQNIYKVTNSKKNNFYAKSPMNQFLLLFITMNKS